MNNQSGAPKAPVGQSLGKVRLERLLVEMVPLPGQPASSIYLRPGDYPGFLEAQGPEGRRWLDRLEPLDKGVLRSDTGIVGLRSGDQGLVVVPPFPLTASGLSEDWDPAGLRAILNNDYTVGVVLLRLGRFSVAVYRGGRLLSSKTDARYVKSRHSAGGTSQLRFQRVREGQIRRLYDKTCEAVGKQFGDFQGELDYLLLGGEQLTLNGFRKVCPYLERYRDITLARRLNVRDPKRDTLDRLPDVIWESRVYRMQW